MEDKSLQLLCEEEQKLVEQYEALIKKILMKRAAIKILGGETTDVFIPTSESVTIKENNYHWDNLIKEAFEKKKKALSVNDLVREILKKHPGKTVQSVKSKITYHASKLAREENNILGAYPLNGKAFMYYLKEWEDGRGKLKKAFLPVE